MREPLNQIVDFIGRFGLAAIFVAISLGCATPQSFAGAENRLFSAAAQSRGKIDEAMRSKIFRHRFVNVDLRPLLPTREAPKSSRATSGLVVLNLFEDAVFRAVLDQREHRSGDSFTWIGHVEGIENSQVTLVVEHGVVSGNIRVDQGFYQIRYAGEGTHVVYQIDPNAFPAEGKPLSAPDNRN
jgi:hypothetical protein